MKDISAIVFTLGGTEDVEIMTLGEQSSAGTSRGVAPRGYLAVIGVLLVIIIVMASYILATSGLLGPEYPNEDTPLEIQAWGITFMMDSRDIFFGHTAYNYTEIDIRFMEFYPSSMGGGGQGGQISPATLARMNYTQFSVPATHELALEFSNGHGTSYGDVHEFVGYFISDDTDPARFDYGDMICLYRVVYEGDSIVDQGFSEGYKYQIGWVWSEPEDGAGLRAGYEFLVDDGRLYSWTHYSPPSIWDY